jgi:hypothetical protein
MPRGQDIDAARFAALWAGFDTGNGDEMEAMAKGRVLRRMAIAANCRVIDVLGRRAVMEALDAQLQPVREPSPDMLALQEEAEEVMQEAEAYREQAEAAIRQLQEELMVARHGAPAARTSVTTVASMTAPINGALIAFVALLALALMFAAAMQ